MVNFEEDGGIIPVSTPPEFTNMTSCKTLSFSIGDTVHLHSWSLFSSVMLVFRGGTYMVRITPIYNA